MTEYLIIRIIMGEYKKLGIIDAKDRKEAVVKAIDKNKLDKYLIGEIMAIPLKNCKMYECIKGEVKEI